MEQKIEREFCKQARKLGYDTIKFSDPGNNGAPDRLVLTPWGLPIFIEFKQPGEQPRPNQIRFLRSLNEKGYLAFTANNVEGPMDILTLLAKENSKDEKRVIYDLLCTRQKIILESRMLKQDK